MPEEIRTKRVTVKVGDDRAVTAKFATLGVRDLDGDIIEAGAIGEQSVLLGAFNHNPGVLPPGSGKTYETDDAAMFQGSFFQTSSGNDLYETIKGDKDAGDVMEWSFRFFVQEGGYETIDEEESYMIRKARVTHVAPVESAAGIDTGTVEIKCDGCDGKGDSAATTLPIDYEKLASTVATAVATAMGESSKSGCGCKDGQNKGDTLGSLLRTLRDEKELTNDDLADAAGLSVETLGQILGGTLKCPKASRLEGLATRLGVNLSSLVEAAESDGCGNYEDDDDDKSGQADADGTKDGVDDQGTVAQADADGTKDGVDDQGAVAQADADGTKDGVDDQGAVAQADADGTKDGVDDQAGTNDASEGQDDGTSDGSQAGATKDGDGDAQDKATDPPDGSIEHQVQALLSGFPGLPDDVDPGIAAFEKYQDAIGAKETNRA